MNESFCLETAALFILHARFHIILLVQIILSIIGIVLCVPAIIEVNKSYFHPNCKSLLIATFVWLFLNALSFTFTMGYLMFTYFLKSGCAIFVSTLFCDIAKGPNTIAIIIASALHLSLCIERIVSSYYGLEYEKQKMIIGPLLITVSTIYAFGVYAWILSSEDFGALIPFCASSNVTTALKTKIFLICSPIVDFISIAIMFLLSRRKRNAKKSYDLNANFSASESQSAYTVLWPFSALHLFAQLTFLLLSAYLPMLLDLKSFSVDDLLTIASLIYVYNAYIVAACLAMLQILWRIRKERKNKIQIAVRDGNDSTICHKMYTLNW